MTKKWVFQSFSSTVYLVLTSSCTNHPKIWNRPEASKSGQFLCYNDVSRFSWNFDNQFSQFHAYVGIHQVKILVSALTISKSIKISFTCSTYLPQQRKHAFPDQSLCGNFLQSLYEQSWVWFLGVSIFCLGPESFRFEPKCFLGVTHMNKAKCFS